MMQICIALHPEDLVSASLEGVTISNMDKCANLKNLLSEDNAYAKEDISHLRNLKRIYNNEDKYTDATPASSRAAN